jgi:heme A synthase
MRNRCFASYAWSVLAYNVLVILYGVFVRATGSGAGCGNRWPLCNGIVVPRSPQFETAVEFGHRLTSALGLVLIVVLVVWGFRLYGKGHPIRGSLLASLLFILTEALIGAGLVLLGLVTDNDSVARALSIALHLVNTFLLLAALTFTAWWASGGAPARFRSQGLAGVGWWLGLTGTLVLGMSGAVTALGDTLFPAQSLAEGLHQDVSLGAHFLIHLRFWHPFIAISVGLYLVLLARTITALSPGRTTTRLSQALMTLVIVQIVAGAINAALLAPTWMQLVHLFLASAVWITLILLGLSAFAVEAPQTDTAGAMAEAAA